MDGASHTTLLIPKYLQYSREATSANKASLTQVETRFASFFPQQAGHRYQWGSRVPPSRRESQVGACGQTLENVYMMDEKEEGAPCPEK